MTVQGQWEEPSDYSDEWDLCSHPAENQPGLSDEEIELRCEHRWAIVRPVDGKFQWEVGYVYFYPVTSDQGICDSLEEAQAKAEEVFVDKYVVNFEKTMEEVR